MGLTQALTRAMMRLQYFDNHLATLQGKNSDSHIPMGKEKENG